MDEEQKTEDISSVPQEHKEDGAGEHREGPPVAFNSWFVFLLGICALGMGWYFLNSFFPQKITIVERTIQEQKDESRFFRRPISRPLEQPQLIATHEPLTALMSNFDISPIDVGAKAVLVSDLTTEVDLFSKDPDKIWPIASITKLLTAAVAEELFLPNRIITVSKDAVAIEGGAGGLQAGEKFQRDNLIQLMLLVSSNDGAEALREEGGDGFLARMHSVVTGLGLRNTHIEEVTGLSPLNVSTPRELKSIVQYMYRVHPTLLRMTMPKGVTISSSFKKHKLVNIDYLSLHPDLGFIGGKTGTIDESGQNIVAVFEHDNHTIAIILLGSSDRFKEVEQLLQWVKKAYTFR